MGRYRISYSKKKAEFSDQPEIHPIWRGIGFALIVLIPILAYFATLVLIELNNVKHWIAIPSDLMNPGKDPYIYIKIIMTIVVSLIVYALFMMITFLSHLLFGPTRYSAIDAPPIHRKVKNRWK